MYRHTETIDVLKEYIGHQIKIYLSEKNPHENYVGVLLEVGNDTIHVECKTLHSSKTRVFSFFTPKNYITKIVCARTWDKTLYQAIRISEEAAKDINNTLGPIKNLLVLLQSDQKNEPVVQKTIRREIEKSQAAVEYLSNLQTL